MDMKVSILALVSFLVGHTAAEWWENANFYQIYPRSFMDSNGDGVGDLNGITQRLEHFNEIGIDAIWLSPIFKSPMADFGYDISDFYSVQPEYGTSEDFDKLAEKCKLLGIRLILDFVPNHSSNENEWFLKSEKREAGFENFYVWHPGKIENGQRVPPNNWISVFRGSAWEWSETRQEYYLHQFLKEQPDLNYRDPHVVSTMKDVLKFWLSRGVSGFRIDAVPYLFEDEQLLDEPLSNADNCVSNDPCFLQHIYTQNHPLTFDMAFQWRKTLDDFQTANKTEGKVLLLEAYAPLEDLMKFYKSESKGIIPFNFELLSNTNINSTGRQYQSFVDRFLDALPSNKIKEANWVLGNHDQKRMSSRLGVGRADLLTILLQTLPGMAVTYYGDEIRMTDVYISWENTIDPAACNTDPEVYYAYSRDPARTPMQWDDTANAGFSTAAKTWLPTADDYQTNNVKLQKSASKSHLKMFQSLTRLRKEEKVLQDGTYDPKIFNDDVIVYRRALKGEPPIFVVLNFGKTAQSVDLNTQFTDAPEELKVLVASTNSNFEVSKMVSTKTLNIPGEVGVVFRSDATIVGGTVMLILSVVSFYLYNFNFL